MPYKYKKPTLFTCAKEAEQGQKDEYPPNVYSLYVNITGYYLPKWKVN